ncbi:hypothetical protein [Sebaldella termitidis]|nr:hypothetical protein [Sebaldella termitidis]
MGGIEMQTKHIEKLEELKGYEWEYHGKKFLLTGQDYLVLKQTDTFDNKGLLCCISLRFIGLENLAELEFYGLKVILNEKPKLTRKEKILIECHEDEFFIARSENNSLCIFEKMPQQCSLGHWGRIWGDDRLVINSELFPFITWESGKAWSKSELMELEVKE